MKIEREELLKWLQTAEVGLSKRDLLEQSSTFVFTDEHLVTFNDEILTRCSNPIPEVQGSVPAPELMGVLSKFPDGMLDMRIKKGELRVSGKRRKAGIVLESEIHLPHHKVPEGEKWKRVPDKLSGVLLQAARCCGKDETQPTTTLVHVTPDMVEACDNDRMFRYTLETGFREEALIPARSLEAAGGLAFARVSLTKGWVHFKLGNGHIVSMRQGHAEKGYPKLDGLLELKDSQAVSLPSNLEDILSRAEVMQESSFDASVRVTIEADMLTLESRKDAGWYKESKKVDYDGEPLRFSVHPKFLLELVAKKKKVRVGKGSKGGDKMKLTEKEATFVVSLEVGK